MAILATNEPQVPVKQLWAMLLLTMIVYTCQRWEWLIPATILSNGTIPDPDIHIPGTKTAGTLPTWKASGVQVPEKRPKVSQGAQDKNLSVDLMRRLQKEVIVQVRWWLISHMEGQTMPMREWPWGGAVSCGFHSVLNWCADIFLHLAGAKANPVLSPGYPIMGVLTRRVPLWFLTARPISTI